MCINIPIGELVPAAGGNRKLGAAVGVALQLEWQLGDVAERLADIDSGPLDCRGACGVVSERNEDVASHPAVVQRGVEHRDAERLELPIVREADAVDGLIEEGE